MKSQLTIDFNAVSHARYFYVQQDSLTVKYLPKFHSVHGAIINPDEHAWPHMQEYPGETTIERAARLGILDVWTPVCVFYFRNNHSITFKGEKAKQKYKQYNQHIYDKPKHSRRK